MGLLLHLLPLLSRCGRNVSDKVKGRMIANVGSRESIKRVQSVTFRGGAGYAESSLLLQIADIDVRFSGRVRLRKKLYAIAFLSCHSHPYFSLGITSSILMMMNIIDCSDIE